MKDIEAYIFLTYYVPKFDMPKQVALDYLNSKKLMAFHMDHNEMNAITAFAPPVKYLCHGLKAEGFSVGWIAEYLKIPQPNVSYHLRTVPKQDWISQSWQYIRNMKRTQLAERSNL
jgi:DNA-binding transcriptional ArsR family regulator